MKLFLKIFLLWFLQVATAAFTFLLLYIITPFFVSVKKPDMGILVWMLIIDKIIITYLITTLINAIVLSKVSNTAINLISIVVLLGIFILSPMLLNYYLFRVGFTYFEFLADQHLPASIFFLSAMWGYLFGLITDRWMLRRKAMQGNSAKHDDFQIS